jgi:uncharacterized protein (DUF433 family)
MATVAYPHVYADDAGVLRVEGTPYKAILLVMTHLAYGFDAGQLVAQYPGLTLAKAHSLLAYYYDNRNELDQLIAERGRRGEQLRASNPPSPLQARLRELKQTRNTVS